MPLSRRVRAAQVGVVQRASTRGNLSPIRQLSTTLSPESKVSTGVQPQPGESLRIRRPSMLTRSRMQPPSSPSDPS